MKPILDKNSDISSFDLSSNIFYKKYWFTDCFFDKYLDKIHSNGSVSKLLFHNGFSESIIEKNFDKLLKYHDSNEYPSVIEYMVRGSILSETFIENYLFKINSDISELSQLCFDIIAYQNISTEFIIKHIDIFASTEIPIYNKYYSEEQLKFIINYCINKKIVYTIDAIACFQKLSNKFISNYIDVLNINLLIKNEKVDQEFVEKLKLIK